MAVPEEIYENWEMEKAEEAIEESNIQNAEPVPQEVEAPEPEPNEQADISEQEVKKEQPDSGQKQSEEQGVFSKVISITVKYITLGIALVLVSFIAVHAFRYSYAFKDYEQEYLQAYLDSKGKNFLVLLCVLILFAVLAKIMFLWKAQTKAGKSKLLYVFLGMECVGCFFVSVIWVKISHSLPYGDQAEVIAAAQSFLQGDFSSLQAGGYINCYPQQLTLTLILEVLFRIFGNGKYYIFQYLNACFMPLLVFSGFKLTESLFHKKEVCLYYLLLMAGCIQLYLYVPYVYGDVGSIACMLLESWLLVRFCQTDKISFLIGGIGASVVSIMLRKNALIFMIAIIIVLVLYAMQRKKVRFFMGAVGILLSYLLMHMAVTGIYEMRSGIQIGDGVPASAFVAMGLQDEWPGPGWYNNYNKEAYQTCGFDTEMTDEMAKANIYERLVTFKADKSAAYGFLKQKLVTQWSEPTYGSFWLNDSFEQEPAEGSLVYTIFSGKIHTLLSHYMNRYQTVIYTFFLISLIAMFFTRRKIYELILPMGIVGGLLFSLMWEAKSRYVLPYFIFMIIYAAFGIYILQHFITKMIARYFASRPETFVATEIDAKKELSDATLGGFDDRREQDKPKKARIFRYRKHKK